MIIRAEAEASDAERQIAGNLVGLKRGDQLKIVRAFRSQIIPPRPPGQRRKETITRARADWKNGATGVELCKRYLPGWEGHNRYRREVEARRLMGAIRSKERREQAAKRTDAAGSHGNHVTATSEDSSGEQDVMNG